MTKLMAIIMHTQQFIFSLCVDSCAISYTIPLWCLSPDPEDYSSAVHYNVTFRQTVTSDEDDPAPTALSEPILIDIVTDYDFEDVEYFQARIVETSDAIRVRIGQDIVNVTIIDRESFTFVLKTSSIYYIGINIMS